MAKHPALELPIRSKMEMIKDIILIIRHLHDGKRELADPLIDDLKIRALFLDEEIQQDVLIFSEQVCFQYDYDPWHKVTREVQKAADRLIDILNPVLLKKDPLFLPNGQGHFQS